MSNPIDNNTRLNGTLINTGRTQGTGNTGKSNEPVAPVEGKNGTAQAGVESERLQMVRDRIDSTPEVDIERVEAIKQSIAEGRYPLDPERIADKFAELEGLLNS
ncbi:flagellar biosynthesis anti-sigma factor FlgM [Alkalilimnicola ehrlichii]|uniref:Negative regulator of flagellin synthesis n=1 Tax=Alkalilimnicola ehrlichii TaxID=351052 RepID=A0A3E0WUA4_9GAMM|nr:flagellar biosynthesis anti-sigma factor FlgM [Alkalilimnicola ehrlichii]RFA28567.1 flagellar biosynthesis anti-sigma factor FlgM [Alkalilimnicola ehrlichii]RFA35731.1 flagellar biosynthesis anti-sigma factor FlgM [Alkalilimnicola ehrlichii]